MPICIQIIVFAANNHPPRGVGKMQLHSAQLEVGRAGERASERGRAIDCGNECYFSHTPPLVEFYMYMHIYFLQLLMILLRLAAFL